MDSTAGRLPAARPGLVSRRLGDDFVVLDTEANHAHSLTGDVATVWQTVLDGSAPDLPDAEIAAALASLRDAGLLDAGPTGPTRRALLQRAGVVAVGVGIASVALPEAVAAASAIFDTVYTTGQTITIPANARAITITVNGGSGGASSASLGGVVGSGAAGGAGGAAIWNLTDATGTAINVLISIGQGGQKAGTGQTVAAAAGGTGYDAGGAGAKATTAVTTGVYSHGGGGGGSTGVNLSGGVTGTLVGAGGGGGSGSIAPGGAGGDASGAAGTLSPGDNGTIANNAARPSGNTGGLGGGQAGNVGTPVTTAGGSSGTAGTVASGDARGAGGGGGGGVVSGTGGQPFTTGTTTSTMGGGGGESYGSVNKGTVSYGTGIAGATGAAGSNGTVRVRYVA